MGVQVSQCLSFGKQLHIHTTAARLIHLRQTTGATAGTGPNVVIEIASYTFRETLEEAGFKGTHNYQQHRRANLCHSL